MASSYSGYAAIQIIDISSILYKFPPGIFKTNTVTSISMQTAELLSNTVNRNLKLPQILFLLLNPNLKGSWSLLSIVHMYTLYILLMLHFLSRVCSRTCLHVSVCVFACMCVNVCASTRLQSPWARSYSPLNPKCAAQSSLCGRTGCTQ